MTPKSMTPKSMTARSMTTVASARTLARYRMWADRLTFDAVAALPPGEATKERPTLFKTMIGTLNHNLVIDLIWQA
ncbi:MAG: DinB family protein, partial [Reyranellales bacterium]